MFTQSCGGIKSGSFNEDFTDALFGRARLLAAAGFVTARLAAGTPVPLAQTARGSAEAFPARRNGSGPRPLPSAIAAIVRPDAMDRSSASTVDPSPSREYSSLRLISNQLTPCAFALGSNRHHSYQHPISAQTFPLQRKSEVPVGQTLLRGLAPLGLPIAAVP